MDAVKFTRAAMRMCNAYYSKCWSCPAGDDTSCKLDSSYSAISAEEKVTIVEQWAAEHPAKTRQSVFLEQYPEAELTQDGVIQICPIAISAAYKDEKGRCKITDSTCSECRKEFWLAEVEE